MDPSNTGRIISEARKQKNLTQKQLADKLFISDKAVSKWERGLCFPDISTLIPLSEILDISLYELLKGEKMNKEEVEVTLKNTIDYSNNQIKKTKKKAVIISVIVIGIILLLSAVLIIKFKNDNGIGAIVDRDILYPISEFTDYRTTLKDTDGSNIEAILMKLGLSWKEKTFSLSDGKITIIYDEPYNTIVKAYNDELYVKEAMLHKATVLFTMVDDLNTVKIKFTDYSYTVERQKLLTAYGISSFEEIADTDGYNNIVSDKLEQKDFVLKTFKKVFTENKLLKK